MNRFYIRVCMLAAGIALALVLAALPAAWAAGKGEAHPGMAHHGPGSEKKHHQGRYQNPHGKRGQQGMQAHGMAAGRHRLPKMMRRALRFMVRALSPEQREQAREIRVKMRRQMNTVRAQLKNFRLDMREILRKFPVDQDAIKAIFDQMAKLRWKLLSSRLSALAGIQNLAGKKLWDEARDHPRGGFRRKPGPPPGPGAGHRMR